MISTYRVTVDETRCGGIGLCEATAPDVFEIGDDGLVRPLVEVVDGSRRHDVEEAAVNCPTRSITVLAIG